MPGIGIVEKMVVYMRAGILLGDLQQKSPRRLTGFDDFRDKEMIKKGFYLYKGWFQ